MGRLGWSIVNAAISIVILVQFLILGRLLVWMELPITMMVAVGIGVLITYTARFTRAKSRTISIIVPIALMIVSALLATTYQYEWAYFWDARRVPFYLLVLCAISWVWEMPYPPLAAKENIAWQMIATLVVALVLWASTIFLWDNAGSWNIMVQTPGLFLLSIPAVRAFVCLLDLRKVSSDDLHQGMRLVFFCTIYAVVTLSMFIGIMVASTYWVY